MAIGKLPADVTGWLKHFSTLLDARLRRRWQKLIRGMLFARGRRTVTSWLRAAGIGAGFQDYYYFLGSLGQRTTTLSTALLSLAVRVIVPGDRVLLAIDDTPTKRYGPKVQGAGIHHNPTPGPADQKFVYGHVWVMMSWVVRHAQWGTLGLPLRALMYIRQKDMAPLPTKTKKVVAFRTKTVMAGELITWAAKTLAEVGKSLWVVVDGAYVKEPVLSAARKDNAVVIGRLRRDAKLFEPPKPPRHRGRGRPRKYGERISLSKRGSHRHGWQTATFTLYGQVARKTYKTFVAVYPPAGGVIRVVIVREEHGWVAFLATDPTLEVAQILEAVADRAAIEQNNHDLKEVYGMGQQQLRNYWANVAAVHLNLWLLTLVELWAWKRTHQQLCDRTASPWDDATRRPSHADRRKALRRLSLANDFCQVTAAQPLTRKCRTLLAAVFKLAI